MNISTAFKTALDNDNLTYFDKGFIVEVIEHGEFDHMILKIFDNEIQDYMRGLITYQELSEHIYDELNFNLGYWTITHLHVEAVIDWFIQYHWLIHPLLH